jgi:hypothetical protein
VLLFKLIFFPGNISGKEGPRESAPGVNVIKLFSHH